MPNFTVTDTVGTTRLFPGVEALLDALERGILGGDDFVYDAGQKSWIRLKDHPVVQAGWRSRQRFRPLDDRNSLANVAGNPVDFPGLDDDGVTPRHGIAVDDEEFQQRRAAWRAVRNAAPAAAPNPDLYLSGERALTRGAILGAVALLALLCGAMVLIARGMAAITR
jgi:hypothetical protein